MFRGLYISGSALITNNNKIDVVSNNIANINTTGYKKDLVLIESFEDTLISKRNGSLNLGRLSQENLFQIEEFDDYYRVESKAGFFKVKTPTGVSYNNQAQFTVGSDGYLRTFYKTQEGDIDSNYGYQVLGKKGPIYVGDGELNIDESGNVSVDGEIVDSLVTVPHHTVIGTMSSGIKLERIETNFQQGQLQTTDNILDFAIRGEGFFVVETQEGIKYTRDGSFKLNEYNELVTSEGYKVQGQYGTIILEGEDIGVDSDGNILVDGEIIDRFEIHNIKNYRDLRKTGEGLFEMEDGIEAELENFEGQILQGRLEGSNVDPIKEMVEMMTLYRGYESNQKMIKAYDETISKAVNEVGKV